ncbi:MAG: VOC family protein [Caldilineales bacterium]
MISNLQMITIYVSDVDRALAFYTSKLGFVKVAEYDDGAGTRLVWVMPEPASRDSLATQIALHAPADRSDPRIGNASGLVFTTRTADEIETTYRELKARDVPFVMDLVRHGYGEGAGDQEARFTDPDGNVFILHT